MQHIRWDKKGNNFKGEKIMGSRFQSLAGLEASSTEEEFIKENQRDLKKKGKATLNDLQEKFLTGKKSTINDSKRVNLGLSVGKLFNGQARDPKTNTLSKDYIKVGSKTGLIPQAYLAANQQAHLDINQQTSSSYGFGQQQETQASKEARTDLSKLPSVTHVSLPNQVKVDPPNLF
ncbi:hypothetical protein Gotri_018284 [Gossypium trilobum]|uniref:Uncharacterized protein n=1 Tax=Gossypium trilobum TaxID=34281 RepID=A0A7J9E978_9ROSI|nr:hypothetical protein [Gossypium trilobum]